MNKSNKNIDDLKNQFLDSGITDPIISSSENKIIISPVYWNYGFITSFFPIFACIYILFKQDDFLVNGLCFLIIICSVVFILFQLKSYNNILINLDTQTITLYPNIFYKLFFPTATIHLKDIKKAKSLSDSFWPSFRRYIIITILNDSEEIKLINANSKENADKLSSLILNIRQNLFP
ncbi:MAG: hypothetical protein ACM3H8_03980 [Sphingobacteriales bacterium]